MTSPLHPTAPQRHAPRNRIPCTPPLLTVVHCFLSFVICNMDRINLSVAIIPMAREFGWQQTRKGVVQAIFFLGYMSTQIVGGKLADAHGGRSVLAFGVLAWSVCTALTAVAADVSFGALLLVRVLMGVGEGVAMPAMNSLVTTAIPDDNARARALAFIYSGMYGGSIVGLLITPAIMSVANWRYVFYVCALVGVAWTALFYAQTAPRGDDDAQPFEPLSQRGDELQPAASPSLSPSPSPSPPPPLATEEGALDGELHGKLELGGENARDGDEQQARLDDEYVPSVCEMLSRRCVWAIIVAHFCCTWGYFVLLSWLPSYLNSRFNVDVAHSSLLATLPWVAMLVSANAGGWVASRLQQRGLSTTHTRKAMQAVGFGGPALMLTLLSGAQRRGAAVALVTGALALGSFSQSGVYANHAEVAPRAAGTLLGVSNTFASVPGLVGVALSGWVLQRTADDWGAVFALAIGFDVLGLCVYSALGTSRRQW